MTALAKVPMEKSTGRVSFLADDANISAEAQLLVDVKAEIFSLTGGNWQK